MHYQRKQNGRGRGAEGREKEEDRKNIKKKKKKKKVGRGTLPAQSPSPPSQVGELGSFLNSSLRRMVGGKVRVGGVWLPWPWRVVVTAAQRPSSPVVHGSRGGVGEVS